MSYYDKKVTETLVREIKNVSGDLEEKLSNIQNCLRRESGYDSEEGEYRDEATILERMHELTMKTITELKDHIENTKGDIISELKDHFDNRLTSIEDSIQEIDNMVRYGPISQVAIDAKSNFESLK